MVRTQVLSPGGSCSFDHGAGDGVLMVMSQVSFCSVHVLCRNPWMVSRAGVILEDETDRSARTGDSEPSKDKKPRVCNFLFSH